MRRLLVTFVSLLALLTPASALAADQTVDINATTGFSPAQAVVRPGEKVTFTNSTPLMASVQFDDETAPRCPTGIETDPATGCQRAFPAAGVFKFFDPQHDPACQSYDTCTDHRGIVIVDGDPTASGLTGPADGLRGQPQSFSASGSDPNGDSIASFNWTWGDGQAESTASGSAQHAYAAAGSYTVTLTVTDSRGNTSAPVSRAINVGIPDRDGDGVNDDADRCPDIAAATADGCPPPAPIITPPSFFMDAVAATTLGRDGVLRSGVTTLLTCSDACDAVFTLLRGERSVGATEVKLTAAGSRLVTVPIAASARRSLAKAKNPTLRLRVAVTNLQGLTKTSTTTIRLQSVKRAGKLPAVGISDQQPSTFSNPLFQILKLRYARLVTPWNSIFTEPQRLDEWLQAARAAGVSPLVSFHHRRGEVCPKRPCTAPSAGQYRRAWKAFHKKYPWVKDISPWNEVNSATQPTGKKPHLAALYYNIVRAACRGCRIVAADLLDTNNLRRYVGEFLKRAKGKPRIWGLHNYRDTNRFRETGTRWLLNLVKGEIWFTETGGIVSFRTQGGKVALPKSESRAKKAMDYMFRLAEKYSARVKRIYVYQWRINNPHDRFDAGVVRADGSPRPSFHVLTLNASVARKR